jgi:phage gp29-like protein
MGLLEDISNKLFKRESKASTTGASNTRLNSYTKLFMRKDNGETIPYKTGLSILRDTQVATGFDILKYLLSSKKWILTNPVEDNTEVYEFIEDMLNDMNIEIQSLVKQMTPAILWGFNVHELLFDVNKDGQLVVTDAVPIHIKTLQNEPFIYDEDTGELLSIHQEVNNQDIEIPVNKVLLYSYNSLYDEKEGHGLLYDFLPIIEDKENVMDWLMTFAERNGSPTLYGKTSDPVSRDQMLLAFDDIAEGTTGLTVGLEEDVGVLESSHHGETFFSILSYKDNQIFRRMFIGNLLLGDNSQTGTYAQSQTQLEFGNMVFDGILEEIANTIQEQIINPVVEFNFGSSIKPPVFSFDKFTSGDMKKLFEIVKPLMDSGVVDSENSAVQESLSLLFKAEAGVEYTNDEPEMPEENFDYQESVNGELLTDNILNDLNAKPEQVD